MSKTAIIVVGVAATAAGLVWLNRRGRAQNEAKGVSGGFADNLRAGVSSVLAPTSSPAPSSSEKEGAGVATPTMAGEDPRVSQRVATERRWEGLLALRSIRPPISTADMFAQGIAT